MKYSPIKPNSAFWWCVGNIFKIDGWCDIICVLKCPLRIGGPGLHRCSDWVIHEEQADKQRSPMAFVFVPEFRFCLFSLDRFLRAKGDSPYRACKTNKSFPLYNLILFSVYHSRANYYNPWRTLWLKRCKKKAGPHFVSILQENQIDIFLEL